jgi:hypothetical protein
MALLLLLELPILAVALVVLREVQEVQERKAVQVL